MIGFILKTAASGAAMAAASQAAKKAIPYVQVRGGIWAGKYAARKAKAAAKEHLKNSSFGSVAEKMSEAIFGKKEPEVIDITPKKEGEMFTDATKDKVKETVGVTLAAASAAAEAGKSAYEDLKPGVKKAAQTASAKGRELFTAARAKITALRGDTSKSE